MNLHCDKCNQTFKNKSSLTRHKLYSCKFNRSRTSRPDNMLSSAFSRRKDKSSVNIDTSSPGSSDKDTDTTTHQQNTGLPNSSDKAIPISTDSDQMKLFMDYVVNGVLSRIEPKLDKLNQIEPKLDKLNQIEDKMDKRITRTPTNVFNIDKIQIYMTDSIDFIEVLTKRMGSRKQAVDFIRSKIHQKVEGDVDVFCEIYLHGEPDTWPISCPDKKNHVFRIAQPDSKVINDPGGVQIYRMFKNVYSNTLLRLNNSMIYETLTKLPGTPEYEASRDQLLDSFELGLIQDKAHALCKAPCDQFIKKLSVKFKSLEKSYELDKAT